MEKRSKILIVDDNSENIRILLEMLKRDYQLNATTDGLKAIDIAKKWMPDLILLDVVMPGLSGYDVFMQLKANPRTKDIPVIFVSAIADIQEEISCLNVGAFDYITKPINPELLKVRIKNFVGIKNERNMLSQMISNKKANIDGCMNTILYTTISIAEFRDKDIGKWHIRRCVEYVKILVKTLLTNVNYQELALTDLAEAICFAVPYHDIGKSVLPDEIILKPDKLTPEEFELMKTHVLIGGDLIETVSAEMEDELGRQTALDLIRYHHERWDGAGYPDGLSGERIPVCARIMALADQYDALVSRRIYRSPSRHFEAVRIISAESGKGFDPEIVNEFLKVHEQFLEVTKKYIDTNNEPLPGEN